MSHRLLRVAIASLLAAGRLVGSAEKKRGTWDRAEASYTAGTSPQVTQRARGSYPAGGTDAATAAATAATTAVSTPAL